MSDYWANLAWPADPVRRQLVLLSGLLGAVALSTLLDVLFALRAFFTAAHQLRAIAPAQ
jgi:ABC-type iron transport system FetAB permease component